VAVLLAPKYPVMKWNDLKEKTRVVGKVRLILIYGDTLNECGAVKTVMGRHSVNKL
jgi:hypothetical protein